MLKEKILELSNSGITQAEIARMLNITSGTVCYHLNPNILKTILERRRNKTKNKIPTINKNIDKEISVVKQPVCWKVAEAKAVVRLIELGYEVFTPFITGGEIDLVAYKNKDSYRVQVKSISPKKNSITISTLRNSVNFKKHSSSKYTNIDFFLIYDGTNIYKVDASDEMKSITLSYSVPKNNQFHKIHMAKDYIF